MPTCTPSGLPMVDCADPPCDVEETLCAFAEALEERFDALDEVIERTNSTVPMAVVEIGEPIPYIPPISTELFSFDTVLADTDNMYNSAAPDVLTINTTGVWSVTATGWGTTTGGGVNISQWGADLRVTGGTLGTGTFTLGGDNRSFFCNGLNVYFTVVTQYQLFAGQQVFAARVLNISGNDRLTAQAVRLSAVWLGDLS